MGAGSFLSNLTQSFAMKPLGVSLMRGKYYYTGVVYDEYEGVYYRQLQLGETLQKGDCGCWPFHAMCFTPIHKDQIGKPVPSANWDESFYRPIYTVDKPEPWHIRLYKLFFTSEI